MLEVLKDFLFPKKCVSCGGWGEYLCPDCLNFIKVNDKRICPQCLRPSVFGITHPGCQKAQSLDGLTSIFVYKNIIKRVITKLKYQFVTDLSETIIELFLSFCGEDKGLTKFVSQKNAYLAPVPLHWQRKNWRGFNQAELLGKMIASKLGIGFIADLLIRTRYTKPQIELEKDAREENIKEAFKINKQSVISSRGRSAPGRNHQPSAILLFDDVWTTGATMRECTKVLKRNKFKRVWGLTLAC